MKVCTSCGESKPLTEYNRHPKGRDGHRTICKGCDGDRARLRKDPGLKQCGKCRKTKPILAFHKNKSRADGRHLDCKECRQAEIKERAAFDSEFRRREVERVQKWKEEHPLPKEQIQNRRLLYLYGIGVDDKNKLWLLQEKSCAICLMLFEVDDLSVDHCHRTGGVRGLLCRKCNLGLGNFDDQPDRLVRAMEYLHQFGSSSSVQ